MADRPRTTLGACPAVECESSFAPERLTTGELMAKLEAVAGGRPYDYYHCEGWCKRIWRIEPYDRARGERYQEPQWIGRWDPVEPVVFKQPQRIMIRWKYLKSRSDPSRAAKNKRDARRQSIF